MTEEGPLADDSRVPGAFLDTERARIWYREEGNGEPLLLLGGFTAGHAVFDFVWPLLTSRYRLVTWEPRGLGQSQSRHASDGEYGVDVWAEDLAELCSTLEITRARIWAQGFASYYAIRFAARWPSLVEALVTYSDVWASDPGKGYGKIWNVYRSVVENLGVTSSGARVLAHLFDVPSPSWFYSWEEANILRTIHAETLSATVGYGLTGADVRADLPNLTVPVLVLQGDEGWHANGEGSEDLSVALMREHVRQLEVVVIPDSHPGYVLIQKPKECVDAVVEFFSRASTSSTVSEGSSAN